MSRQDSSKLKLTPSVAPKPTTAPAISPDCRAKRLTGIDRFTECHTQAPGSCQFLFIYGHGRFCTHPLREQIVKQS